MDKMLPYEAQGILVRMAIAVLSLGVSIVILLLIPNWVETRESSEISVWYNIGLLQTIGGVFLIVGSLKANHWMFLPWLVAAIIFIYTLLYKTLSYYCYLHGKRLVLVIPLFYIIAGFWLYFLCDVFKDFLDLHRKSSPEIPSHDPL
ncbi:uncharacterized protein LOC111073866 [Drosophila obscura]|uniref:uncharacterized protein LOC111073866 n=1 Tax=Drosophila obscura TaxID=7282 RepID=UPI001BB1FFF1|nr:uncharacterized protein LOC111073866 [Drosophila obscura]